MRENYRKIIKKAYGFLEGNSHFRSKISDLKFSIFNYFKDNEEYSTLYSIFKALEQDYAKILITLNNIEKIYSEYQRNEYKNNYVDWFNFDSPNSQLGCLIEYLFVKYRVIFEYIQEILDLTLPKKFNENEKKQFNSLNKKHDKYKFLLEYVYNNISDEEKEFLNIDWLENIRINRNFLIHCGATCMACADKKNDLIFQINTRDFFDYKELIEENIFYTNLNTNFIYYPRYWGLQLSRLIVFLVTILDFITKDTQFDIEAKGMFELTFGQNLKFENDKETVLKNMLKKLIE